MSYYKKRIRAIPNYHQSFHRLTLNFYLVSPWAGSKQLTGWQQSLDHTLRSGARLEPGPMPTQGPHWTVLLPGLRGGGLKGSQPSAPFRGSCLAGENKHISHTHLSLSVFFEFVFPLTYFPFSLGFIIVMFSVLHFIWEPHFCFLLTGGHFPLPCKFLLRGAPLRLPIAVCILVCD